MVHADHLFRVQTVYGFILKHDKHEIEKFINVAKKSMTQEEIVKFDQFLEEKHQSQHVRWTKINPGKIFEVDWFDFGVAVADYVSSTLDLSTSSFGEYCHDFTTFHNCICAIGIWTGEYDIHDLLTPFVRGDAVSIENPKPVIKFKEPTTKQRTKMIDLFGQYYRLERLYVPNDCICCARKNKKKMFHVI